MYKDYRSTSRSGISPLSFDPAANNEPLHFGGSSGPLVTECPPLENGAENSKKRKRSTLPTAEVIHNIPMDSSAMSMPMSEPSAWATAMNNLGMPQIGLGTQTLLPDYDPNMGMMTNYSTDYSTDYSSMNMMTGLGMIPDVPVVKEIIHCKSCTLFPPNPNLPFPETRNRPPGCKTVFVGGLPENSSEEIVEEIFGPCGPIIAIRKSKKTSATFALPRSTLWTGRSTCLVTASAWAPAPTRRTAGVSMWTLLRPETTCTSGNVFSGCWHERSATDAR